MLLEESDFGEDLWYAFCYGLTIISADFHGEGNIFSHGFASEEFEVLEYDTHSPAVLEEFTTRELGDITSSIIIYLSLLGSDRADHRPDHTRLATSRCTDQEDELTTLNLEIYIS